ncbi:hypothetical protein [Photobacterium sanctipauli]|uniref:hypothetical protein n=1 Tax=Photobacterium sanctipauli TaxID=1342794 RepID=UPI000AF87FEE|nr:hypothetical protein [Photobacterium sanctipauli]
MKYLALILSLFCVLISLLLKEKAITGLFIIGFALLVIVAAKEAVSLRKMKKQTYFIFY